MVHCILFTNQLSTWHLQHEINHEKEYLSTDENKPIIMMMVLNFFYYIFSVGPSFSLTYAMFCMFRQFLRSNFYSQAGIHYYTHWIHQDQNDDLIPFLWYSVWMPRTKPQCMKCHLLMFYFGFGVGSLFVLAFCHWRFVPRSISLYLILQVCTSHSTTCYLVIAIISIHVK